MRHGSSLLVALLTLALALPEAALAAWPHDPYLLGAPVCTAAQDQSIPVAVEDGAGGAFVAWVDARSGDFEIYVQHVDVRGDALWTANGVRLTNLVSPQTTPRIAADGAGGAIVTWVDLRTGDYDLYAQRVNAAGAPLWAANGVPVCTATGIQEQQVLVRDGVGGVIIAWVDGRSGDLDLYAQRLNGSGAALWAATGVVACNAIGSQTSLTIAPDALGGAFVAWADLRGASRDIYAQRLNSSGVAQWAANGLGVCLAALEQDQVVASADGAGGVLLAWQDYRGGASFDVYAWEVVGTLSAAYLAQHSLTVATLADSVAGSNPYTAFMVEARSGASVTSDHWYSAPDSGYSVDNLAPAAPSPFAGVYGGGVSSLYWGPNAAADLAGYRLYRGTSASFEPKPSNRLTETGGTSYVDAAGQPYWYKLSAVDVHGNESGFTTLLPGGSLAADGALPGAVALASPSPNPARGTTTLRYALPREARVRLALFDASGRHVRTLVDGARAAGEHAATWDLRDAAGRAVGAGLYFARLEAEGRRRVEKVLTMR